MTHSRREFFRRTGCSALALAATSAGLERLGLVSALAQQAAPTDYRALVCIFLNGGNDGNNMVVPLDATGYGAYSTARSSAGLAIAQGLLLPIAPTSPNTAFGLHPSLVEVQALFNQHYLAVVTNVGPLVEPLTRQQYQAGSPRPYQLFSHSDQIAQWQTSRSDAAVQSGWGGRTADFTASANPGAIYPVVTSFSGSAVFTQGNVTRPIAVSPAPTPLNQVLVLNGFSTAADAMARRTSMNELRGMDRGPTLVAATSDAMQQAVDIGAALSSDPTLATVFPNTTLGNQLRQVAKLIKLNQTAPALGLNRQIFFCSLGGFDTHGNQLVNQANLLAQLSQAMNAFYAATVELALQNRVTTFTLSDFARTLQPSGSGASVGSDHAWGNHQFVMGGAVNGGSFYGVPGPNLTVFPTLSLGGQNDADTRGRWIPTAAVEQYAATLATWFGLAAADVATVFPLIGRFTTPDLGFML